VGSSSHKSIVPTVVPTQPLILADELGKCVARAVELYQSTNSFEDFIRACQGPSDLQSNIGKLPHPAATLLDEYRTNGVPYKTRADNWTPNLRREALLRGAHQSAYQYQDFVREEFVDMIKKRFWVVLPAALLMEYEDLRLSPLGVVPQHERRPRIICDYTYYGVNQDTAPDAPPEAMQFGRTLRRILQKLADANPMYGPVYMAKYDMSDGFYRLQLSLDSILPLAVMLPTMSQEDPLVALPLVVTMGWTEAPPAFSTTTETSTDLANWELESKNYIPPHHLEPLADTPPRDYKPRDESRMKASVASRTYAPSPVTYVDVYVDDEIGLAQGPKTARSRVTRAIMHSIDKIMRPLDPTDSEARREPISVTKLEKGDGFMDTKKTILGWEFDTVEMTIHLSARRRQRLHDILAELPRTRKRMPIKAWHKVLGELRSMSLALPGSRGLFSALQVRFKTDQTRIRLTRMVHDFLDDFRYVASTLDDRPTRIYEVVPTSPHIVGTTDASGIGMGGVFFLPAPWATPNHPDYFPYMWRSEFPPSVQQQLLTFDNPKGTVTNSDLELSGTVAHHDVIATHFGVAETTIGTAHDNYAAVIWNRKGSTSTTGPAAYLLRLQALHARHHRYVPLHDFIPGHLNRLADEASRRFHLTDDEILSHFDQHYPQPRAWKLLTLRPAMHSALISCLHRKRVDPPSVLHEPVAQTSIGDTGWSSVPRTPWIPTTPPKTLYRTYKCSPDESVMDASHPPAEPFALTQLLTPYETWDRRTQGWGPLTSEMTPQDELTCAFPDNSVSTPNKTTLQDA